MANFCTKCGSRIAPRAKFCGECGTPITIINNNVPPQQGQSGYSQNPQAPYSQTQQTRNSYSQSQQTPNGYPQSQQTRNPYSQTRNPYSQTRNPDIPSRAAQNTAAGPKKKKRLRIPVLCIFLAVTILFTGFKYPGFFLEKNEPDVNNTTMVEGPEEKKEDSRQTTEAVNTETATLKAEGGSVTLCGVTVNCDSRNINGEETVTVTEYAPYEDGTGEKHLHYDVSVGNHRQFEVPVAVTFPCSLSGDEDAAVLHYLEDLNEWIPLAAEYDAGTQTITAYFSSLSPSEIVIEKKDAHNSLFYIEYSTNKSGEKSTRNAEIKVSDYYWSILKRTNPEALSNDALKYIADPALYAEDLEKYMDSYRRDASEAFESVNSVWTEWAPVLDLCKDKPETILPKIGKVNTLGFGKALGNAMGIVSVVMAGFQGLNDFKNAGGDINAIQAPATNLYKNISTGSGTVYSLVTGYGSAGFTLAFVGVTMVGFALDKAVSDAQKAIDDRTADIFYSYFENVAPFNANQWYEVFHEAYYQSNQDPDEAMKIISAQIDSTVEGFWTDIADETNSDLLLSAVEADTKNMWTKNNIFLEPTKKQKKQLNIQMKHVLWQKFKKETLPMVQQFLIERMQDEIYAELSSISDPFNEYMHFDILESVPDMNDASSICSYAGCTLAFGVNGTPLKDWEPIEIDESCTEGWTAEYDCTLFGWMQAGMPDSLLIYKNYDEYINGKAPIRQVDFMAETASGKRTRIDLTVGGKGLVWGLESIEYTAHNFSEGTTAEDYNNGEKKGSGEYTSDGNYIDEYLMNSPEIPIITPMFDRYYSADENGFEFTHTDALGCDYSLTAMMPGKIVRTNDDFVVGIHVEGCISSECCLRTSPDYTEGGLGCGPGIMSDISPTVKDGELIWSPYFKLENGKIEGFFTEDELDCDIRKDYTLYGSEAIPMMTEGQDIMLFLCDGVGGVYYTYRVMTEEEARTLETTIIKQ